MHLDGEDNGFDIPEDIFKKSFEVTSNLLPSKPKDRYENEYNHFCKW